MDIAEFKQNNPDYKDVPDLELADALHAKFYADVPRDQFLQQVGLAGTGGNFATTMPRADYAKQFLANNPDADQSALDVALSQYDKAQAARTEARGNAVQDKFKQLASPEAMFDVRLNERLQGPANGVVPQLPARQQPDRIATPKPAPTLAQEIGGNVTGGLMGGLAGAGAALSSLVGADDTAAGLDAARRAIEEREHDELGGDTIVGRASSLVGGIAPALAVPSELVPQLAANTGLFAIPAFRDTYKAKIAQGQSENLALAHAAEAAGINLLAPSIAARGIGGVIGKAAGEGGLLGAAGQLGAAAGEGVGFSALNTVSDKATDLIAGQQNNNAWIDPKDMAAQALGFGVLRVPHAVGEAMTPRATVADIAKAQDVDQAIAAATAAVPSINTDAIAKGNDADVAAILKAIRPPEAKPAEVADTAPVAQPEPESTNDARLPAPALPVDDGVGRSNGNAGELVPAVERATGVPGAVDGGERADTGLAAPDAGSHVPVADGAANGEQALTGQPSSLDTMPAHAREGETQPLPTADRPAFRDTTVEDSNGKKMPGITAEFDSGEGGRGMLELGIKDGRLFPTYADNGLKFGQSSSGKMRAMYEGAISEAARRGLRFTSDDSVTTDAARIYDSLAKRDYTVEKNPSARLAEPPEVVTPRWMTDDGSPVYTVQAKSLPEQVATATAIINGMKPNPVHGKLAVVDPSTLGRDGKTIAPEDAALVQGLGRALGKEVVFFRQDGNKKRLDGFASPKHPDLLFVNVGHGDAAWHVVAGHEFFHQMPDELRGAFIDAVKPLVPSEQFKALQQYINQPHLDEAGHWEEIAADLFGNRFAEPDFLRDLLGNIKDKGTAGKVMAYLRDFIDRIASLVSGKRFATDEFVADLDKIRAAAAEAIGHYMEGRGKIKAPFDVKEESHAPELQSGEREDWQDEHRPPMADSGAPLHDLTGDGQIYPDDVYSSNGSRYYGTGYDALDKQAFRIANMAKGNPDYDVMIFRAVPKDINADIRPGDWVTISRGYAQEHGESRFDGDYKIISKMVKAKDIYTNGDSILEWGYDPQNAKLSDERDNSHFVRVTLPTGHSMVEKVAAPDAETALRRARSEHAYAEDTHIVPREEVERNYPYLIEERRAELRLSDERKTVEVDGIERPVVNSSGRPLAATEEGVRNFWRWFGDSKVVDEQGKPLVVYHNTHTQGIQEFLPFGRSLLNGDMSLDEIKAQVEKWRAAQQQNEPVGYMSFRNGTFFTPHAEMYEGYGPHKYAVYIKAEHPVIFDGVSKKARGDNPSIRRDALFIENNGELNEIAVFDPAQIKSAADNNGDFSPYTNDIRFSQQRADELKDRLSRMVQIPKGALASAAFHTKMLVMPMSAGSEHGQAFAKDFANSMRKAQLQWAAFDKVLAKHYTDEQLEKMWRAADEENDLRREGKTSDTLGLASLTPNQRATVELLHAYGEELWAKAKDAGLVSGDGVAFWTPRVAARIYADGVADRLDSGPAEFSKEARNLRTSASSTKERKYDTTAESEAALKAKHGEDAGYVKNIRVMPMAMAQLEKAIAGRTLINQIKAHGQVSGQDLVRDSDTGDRNYATFDHPAMKRWMPKMDWQPADEVKLAVRGYTVKPDGVYAKDGEKLASYRVRDSVAEQLRPVVDAEGKPVLEARPLFVHKDFIGPLKSVFTTEPNAVYRGYMEMKGLSMSLIMVSPLTHNMVIWGKALPSMVTAMGWKGNLKNIATGGLYSYFLGHKVRQDHALMGELVDKGLVPMGGRGMNPDLPAIANGIQPGRSIMAKALGAVFDLAHVKAGDAARRTIDAVGHFWHETLLWDRIADMQAGMAVQMRNHFIDKGLDQDTATRIATFFANRYAGAVPHEAISEAAHALMNVTLFSKSFTMTNLGAMKDPFMGLPKDVQAQIRLRTIEAQRALGKTGIEATDAAGKVLDQAQSVTLKKAGAILLVDFAAMAALTSLTQAWFAGQSGQQWWEDLKERTARLGVKLDADNPMAFLGPQWGKLGLPAAFLRHPFANLQALSQTDDNPHGKEDRVRIGEDEQGNTYYLRLPTGKVVEEMKQYLGIGTGLHLLHNKMSPMARAVAEVMENQDFQGRRVFLETDGAMQQVGAIAGHILKSQVPFDDMVALKHVMAGDKDQGGKVHLLGRDLNMDEAKLLGTATGLSVSKLSGGDAVAEMRYASREHEAAIRDVLPDVRELVRREQFDEAEQKLVDAGQSVQEARRTLRAIEQPDRISRAAVQKFARHADDQEQARLDRIKNR
jgi:hypothetical protein